MYKLSDFFDNVPEFDFNNEQKKLIESLTFLKSLSVEEFTFFKKWSELNKPTIANDIGSDASIIENKIWKPSDINNLESTINEIQSINPEIIFVAENSKYYRDWLIVRLMCHTMEYNQSPGRFIRFLIADKTSGKYLGVLSVASDVISITDRDNYIGWTSDNKLKDKKLAHSAIGSCIMATQPFGYNFLGGKLMACLITSSVIRNKWKELYNQTLVSMTTTSLYGSYSMYNSLKWWHKCGTSSGKILITPSQDCYDTWHDWIKKNRKDEYIKAMTQKEGVSGPVTAAKLKILSMIMSACNIKQKDFCHGYLRGVYSSLFYENTKEFLCNKLTEDKLVMKSLFKSDIDGIMSWWKVKAVDRYKTLHAENRLKPNVLFYDKMIGMSYNEAKNKYFSDVGN